jgi:catechol 2,3-dioxygenase-like lactoylglutathione lyase family enzyme
VTDIEFSHTLTRASRSEDMVSVRYMVDDVDTAIAFYTTQLGFTVRSSAPPAFADVVRGNLRLLLSGPASSAGRSLPDGRRPGPGAGTASIWSSATSEPRWSACAPPASGSAARGT